MGSDSFISVRDDVFGPVKDIFSVDHSYTTITLVT